MMMNERITRDTMRQNAHENANKRIKAAEERNGEANCLSPDGEYHGCLGEEVFRVTYRFPPQDHSKPYDHDFDYLGWRIEIKTTPHPNLILNKDKPFNADIYIYYHYDKDTDWAIAKGWATKAELKATTPRLFRNDMCHHIYYKKLRPMDTLIDYLIK